MFLFARRSGMILTLVAALAAALATLAGCGGGGGGGGDNGGGNTTTGSTTTGSTTTGSTTTGSTTTGSTTTGSTTGTVSTPYTVTGSLHDIATGFPAGSRIVTIVGAPAFTSTTNNSGVFTIPNISLTTTFQLQVKETSGFVDGTITVNPAAYSGTVKNIGVHTFDFSSGPPPPPPVVN
ncbi:MAG: hypothetical protein ABIY70_18175 [Capsulimonas sp.]|uniref:hypothetical protein n=1 Tax=Capsulimonas sp. TaxID=2494211 RepID=UPI0032632D7C